MLNLFLTLGIMNRPEPIIIPITEVVKTIRCMSTTGLDNLFTISSILSDNIWACSTAKARESSDSDNLSNSKRELLKRETRSVACLDSSSFLMLNQLSPVCISSICFPTSL